MDNNCFTVKSSNITLSCDGDIWSLNIHTEDYTTIQARFPDLNCYPVLVDGDVGTDAHTLSRIFTMSPYNYYDCELHRMGDTIVVGSVVVRNRLLDGEVLHRISFGV
jgi:hypothetical protein